MIAWRLCSAATHTPPSQPAVLQMDRYTWRKTCGEQCLNASSEMQQFPGSGLFFPLNCFPKELPTVTAIPLVPVCRFGCDVWMPVHRTMCTSLEVHADFFGVTGKQKCWSISKGVLKRGKGSL